MSPLVVDANIVIKWLVDEPDAEAARGVLASGTELHAPRLMAAEVAHVLWKKARKDEIAPASAAALADSVPHYPLHWADDELLFTHAVRLAIELRHPAYDCMYLALAEHLGTRLVTADMRFVNRVRRTAHRDAVLPLSEYAAT